MTVNYQAEQAILVAFATTTANAVRERNGSENVLIVIVDESEDGSSTTQRQYFTRDEKEKRDVHINND